MSGLHFASSSSPCVVGGLHRIRVRAPDTLQWKTFVMAAHTHTHTHTLTHSLARSLTHTHAHCLTYFPNPHSSCCYPLLPSSSPHHHSLNPIPSQTHHTHSSHLTIHTHSTPSHTHHTYSPSLSPYPPTHSPHPSHPAFSKEVTPPSRDYLRSSSCMFHGIWK